MTIQRAAPGGHGAFCRAISRLLLICLPLLLAGCSTPHRLPAVPSALGAQARPQVDHVRFILGLNFEEFGDEYMLSLKREHEAYAAQGHVGPLPPSSFL